MATVTVSIGATARDYATIAGFEADLDNDTPFDAGDDVIGEAYNDSAFSENVTFNGGGTLGIASCTLTVATGEEHDGTPGSGVANVTSTDDEIFYFDGSAGIPYHISWFDCDRNGGNSHLDMVTLRNGVTGSVKNCLIHGGNSSRTSICEGISTQGAASVIDIFNNVIFDIVNANSGGVSGIYLTGGSTHRVYNNTITDLHCGNSLGVAYGITVLDDADHDYKNNLVTNITNTGGGSAVCYSDSAPSNATHATNFSDDTTSPDVAGRSISVTFTNAAADDYSLSSGDTDVIDAGTDLGTTANIDAAGYDRDAGGGSWDGGAFEYVSAGAIYNESQSDVSLSVSSNANSLVIGYTVSDLVSCNDLPSAALVYFESLTDALDGIDDISISLTISQSVSDIIATVDNGISTATFNMSLTEALSAIDTNTSSIAGQLFYITRLVLSRYLDLVADDRAFQEITLTDSPANQIKVNIKPLN